MRVKTDEKVVNNSSDEELIQALRSIWLGMRDSNTYDNSVDIDLFTVNSLV